MRTETKTEQRVITDTYTVYISDNGKVFETKKACEEYEKTLKVAEYKRRIDKLKINNLDDILPITLNGEDWREYNTRWYNVKDKNDYDAIYNYYTLSSYMYYLEPESYPTVIGIVENYDFVDVYSIDSIIDQVKCFFSKLNMSVNIKEKKVIK